MSLVVLVTAEAEQQFTELVSWWDEHRPAASVRLEDELERVLSLLAEHPGLGRQYERPGRRLVRHYPLHGTPYHVFYAVDSDERVLCVLAIWSMMRKAGPALPR